MTQLQVREYYRINCECAKFRLSSDACEWLAPYMHFWNLFQLSVCHASAFTIPPWTPVNHWEQVLSVAGTKLGFFLSCREMSGCVSKQAACTSTTAWWQIFRCNVKISWKRKSCWASVPRAAAAWVEAESLSAGLKYLLSVYFLIWIQ